MGARALLERLAVTFYMITFMSGIWGWFLLPVFLFNWITVVPYAIYLYLTWFGPLSTANQNVKWPNPFKRLPVWKYAASFYPAKIVKTAELDPDGNYIFCAHPHGIFCSSLFLAFATEAMDFSRLYPGIDVHFLTLPAHFKNPFVRDWILLHGMLDTSRATCKRILSGGTGRSIAMAIGGARECLFVEPGLLNIILDRRMGFIRVAMETGASLVPVISFGENELFDAKVVGPDTPFGRFQLWGLKHTGITSPNFSWAGPHRKPINTVIGAPIKVPKFEGDVFGEGGQAAARKLHSQYKEALLDLYQKHKGEYHAQRREELKIIA
jgi:1-acyl-sn-glycerol-3-phosphate acyltransferase